jgi:integrase
VSLYKQRASEVWWLNISHPGHPRVRESTGEHDRDAAQKVHDERKAALWKIDPALRGKTWGNAVNLWIDAETRSDSELLSLAKFGRVYKDRMLVAVTPESIDAALSFCKTPGTYTRYRTMINAILHLSGVNLKLTSKRDKKKKPREWITPEQWKKLHAELPPHMKPMAEFALETGIRQANVLGLTWSRVDLQRKVAWVEAEDMKADQAIAIPLSKGALRVLKAQFGSEHANDEFCFTFRGKPISEIKTAFIGACVRSGVGRMDSSGKYQGFTWHGLRHTWATWHIQNGTPLEVLQKLGSWSDLRMVLNYAHHSPGHLAGYADNATKREK